MMMDTDAGRVPLAPGSRPTDQAPSGLGASRFDPSRERDYAIRWANQSVDMLKDAFFPVADALRDLEYYLRDTPHHNAIEAAAARKALARFDAPDVVTAGIRAATRDRAADWRHPDIEGHIADEVRDACRIVLGKVVSFDDSLSIANSIIDKVVSLPKIRKPERAARDSDTHPKGGDASGSGSAE